VNSTPCVEKLSGFWASARHSIGPKFESATCDRIERNIRASPFGDACSLAWSQVSGQRQRDFLCYLGILDTWIAESRVPHRQLLQQVTSMEEAVDSLPDGALASRMFLQNLSYIPVLLANDAARIRLARTAIALERYRREHDSYPKTLDSLTPRHLEVLLTDPFTEESLNYSPPLLNRLSRVFSAAGDSDSRSAWVAQFPPKPDAYLIYSAGLNAPGMPRNYFRRPPPVLEVYSLGAELR
jgi:hypothetical protein